MALVDDPFGKGSKYVLDGQGFMVERPVPLEGENHELTAAEILLRRNSILNKPVYRYRDNRPEDNEPDTDINRDTPIWPKGRFERKD